MSAIQGKGQLNSFILGLLIVLCALTFSKPLYPDKLTVPLRGKDIELNYWSAQNNNYGALIWIRAEASMMPESIAEQLSEQGWGILLIDAKPSTELKRQIPAAIRELRKLHYPRIILLHQGDRLQKTLDYFSKPPSKRVDGFIFLSAYDSNKDVNLSRLSSPVMDICGQFDYQHVINDFQSRKDQEKYRDYRSMQVPGADYSYEYQLKLLMSYMEGWMKNIPPIQPAWLPFQLGEFPRSVYGFRIARLLALR